MQDGQAISEDLELPLDGEISVTRKVGRKPKINELPPLVYTRMLNKIRIGVSDEVAATLIGIYPGTFYRWMARGRGALEIELTLNDDENPSAVEDKKLLEAKLRKLDPDGLYRQFCEDVSRAKAFCLGSCEVRIREESPLTWARRHDKRWRETGSDIQVNHAGTIDQNISGQIEHQVSDQIEAGLIHIPDMPTVLSALQTFEELGYIELTESGKALFQKQRVNLPAPKSDPVKQSTSGN
jgi:hypothetical protein